MSKVKIIVLMFAVALFCCTDLRAMKKSCDGVERETGSQSKNDGAEWKANRPSRGDFYSSRRRTATITRQREKSNSRKRRSETKPETSR